MTVHPLSLSFDGSDDKGLQKMNPIRKENSYSVS